jgi:hypothetical protein
MNDMKEALEQQEKEGHGTVPNAPVGKSEGEVEEIKRALHEIEEEKGDWNKDR